MAQDYYSTLGVSKSASGAEIKASYKKLAKKYHPDVNQDPGSQDEFKEISKAYKILSDEQKRAAYDRMGHDGFEQAEKGGFRGGTGGGFGRGTGDINFEDLFGGGYRDPMDIFSEMFGGGKSSSRSSRGEDISEVIKLTFDEAVKGKQKEILYNRFSKCEHCGGSGSQGNKGTSTCTQCGGTGKVRATQSMLGAQFTTIVPCPTCKGKGQIIENPCVYCSGTGRSIKNESITIDVPAGVQHGMQIRYPGKGHAGENNAPNGDLYLTFKVEQHKELTISGIDVQSETTVSSIDAILGTSISITTIDGKKNLKIPAGTQPETVFELKGMVISDVRNGKRKGNQYITVHVKIPKKLTKEVKELYEKIATIQGKPKSFLDNILS